MSEKSMTPEIRFKGFNDPWEQRKLGDELAFLKNNTLSRADLSDSEGLVRNVHYGDVLIKFGSILDALDPRLPRVANVETASSLSSDPLRDGDVVVADTAEDDAVGKCSELRGVGNCEVVAGLHTIPLRPFENYAPGFLGYYLNSDAYHDQLKPLMQGIKVISVSRAALAETQMLTPGFDEQRQIGRYFASLDSLITLHQRKYDKLVQMKKAMLDKMFPKQGESVPEIRFKGFTDPWEQRKLGDLCAFAKGHGYSKADVRDAGTPLILYGRLYTQYESRIDDVDTFAIEQEGSLCSKGNEVIVPASGETADDIAVAASVRRSGVILGGDLNVITPGNELDPDYVALGITYGKAHRDLAKRAQGKSVVHIHGDDISDIEFAYPSVSEQRTISSAVLSLDSLITLHQRKLELLKNVKKAMLNKMFT